MLQQDKQDKLQKVTYQTHGTCSKYICISIDEDGNVQDAHSSSEAAMAIPRAFVL